MPIPKMSFPVEVAVGRLTAFVIALLVTIDVTSAPPAFTTVGKDSALSRIAVVGDSYTTGTDEGGWGAKSWTSRTWRTLARRGMTVTADVAAEGRAGYAVRGDHDSLFSDLTGKVVQPTDEMVVFFGSRNDKDVDPEVFAETARNTFDVARRAAPSAMFLVIGPPWPTAEVPDSLLQIRDALHAEARNAGAAFVDPLAERWFVGKPELIGPDGVHPNDAGHAYLAEKIAPLIGTRLTKSV